MAKLGSDLLTVPQDVLATLPNTLSGVTTSPQAGLGSRATTPDGRVYRYAQVGGSNLVAGNLLQGVATTANHQHVNPTSAAGTATFTAVITVGATAVTANQYANGYMIIDTGTNHLGYTYSILSNSAAASSGSTTLLLGEPLVNALATTDYVSLIPNPYSGVIQNPTTKTGPVVGVAVTAASASYYCWVQTRGPAAVLADANTASAGGGLVPSILTAGSVAAAGTTTTYGVGSAIIAGTSAQCNPVFLTIE